MALTEDSAKKIVNQSREHPERDPYDMLSGRLSKRFRDKKDLKDSMEEDFPVYLVSGDVNLTTGTLDADKKAKAVTFFGEADFARLRGGLADELNVNKEEMLSDYEEAGGVVLINADQIKGTLDYAETLNHELGHVECHQNDECNLRAKPHDELHAELNAQKQAVRQGLDEVLIATLCYSNDLVLKN